MHELVVFGNCFGRFHGRKWGCGMTTLWGGNRSGSCVGFSTSGFHHLTADLGQLLLGLLSLWRNWDGRSISILWCSHPHVGQFTLLEDFSQAFVSLLSLTWISWDINLQAALMVFRFHYLCPCTRHLRVVIGKFTGLEILTLLLLTSGLIGIVLRDVVLMFLKLGSDWLWGWLFEIGSILH